MEDEKREEKKNAVYENAVYVHYTLKPILVHLKQRVLKKKIGKSMVFHLDCGTDVVGIPILVLSTGI
jgi:hypothetical protein